MFLKPKSTVNNPRALLYRRFTSLEDSFSQKVVYKTAIDGKYWLFDAQKKQFTEIPVANPESTVIAVQNSLAFFYYNKTIWHYAWIPNVGYGWRISQTAPGSLLSAAYANVAKYQTNKYYFAGSFDFMVRGSIEGSTIQYAKGLITPQSSMNIRTFDDTLEVRPDDLVVVDGSLYAVENPMVVYKRMPKKFGVYYMTLNNIL